MKFLIFLLCLYTKIIPTSIKQPIQIYKKLTNKTVLLIKSTIKVKNVNTGEWKDADENLDLVTTLKIFKDNDSNSLADINSTPIFNDSKYERHNVFFFTSYKGTGYYTLSFEINSTANLSFGLELEVYEGNAQNVEIMSNIDYHMNWLTQKIGDMLTFARSNFDIEELGSKDENEYVRLYNRIFSLVLWISVTKIAVLFVTIFYINKSVKKFFITQKIAK